MATELTRYTGGEPVVVERVGSDEFVYKAPWYSDDGWVDTIDARDLAESLRQGEPVGSIESDRPDYFDKTDGSGMVWKEDVLINDFFSDDRLWANRDELVEWLEDEFDESIESTAPSDDIEDIQQRHFVEGVEEGADLARDASDLYIFAVPRHNMGAGTFDAIDERGYRVDIVYPPNQVERFNNEYKGHCVAISRRD